MVLAVGVLLMAVLSARPAETLHAARGEVRKVSKTTLTFAPRDEKGRFEKEVELKLIGTSRVTLVSERKSKGKMVLVQTNTEFKKLKSKQPIAVIYATGKEGSVLLSAVAQSGGK
jgi:hypothetical protein